MRESETDKISKIKAKIDSLRGKERQRLKKNAIRRAKEYEREELAAREEFEQYKSQIDLARSEGRWYDVSRMERGLGEAERKMLHKAARCAIWQNAFLPKPTKEEEENARLLNGSIGY